MKYFLKFHHGIAFLVISFLIVEMIYLLWCRYYGTQIKGELFFKIILNGTIVTMLFQILIGLFLMNFYFFSFKNEINIIKILKQEKIRLKLIEHPIMMMIGFFIFVLFYNKFFQKKQITNTVLFLFFLSVLTIMIRFPFKI